MANEPITREEIMLNAIATGEAANLEPITREEMFLAKLGGADVNTPTPITRKEQFLQKAIECGGSGGGGGTGDSQLDALIEGTLTDINTNAKVVRSNAFNSYTALTTANIPEATSIGNTAFSGCTALTTVNNPKVTDIGNGAFTKCSSLTTIDFSNVVTIGTYAFEKCSALTTVKFPKITGNIQNNSFSGCSALTMADFYKAGGINSSAFVNTALTALILRGDGSVCSLGTTAAFNNTPIKAGTGYIYVPSAIIARYKAATNWSTYAAQFRALEDYTVDGTITGELDPSKI